ncbi:MAG: hypothetical protein HY588_03145, partial [Candidatus Omnitrophica bacterium]|nr:hypothetical protein [Candidatus Omnitrophota bacterium]
SVPLLGLGFHWPNLSEWILLGGVTAGAFFGQVWLTRSIQNAPVASVLPFAYLTPVFAAPFQIPYHLLQGTLYGPPVVGTVGGVFTGTFRTISDLVGGTFDMAASLAPYAKYAIFFI